MASNRPGVRAVCGCCAAGVGNNCGSSRRWTCSAPAWRPPTPATRALAGRARSANGHDLVLSSGRPDWVSQQAPSGSVTGRICAVCAGSVWAGSLQVGEPCDGEPRVVRGGGRSSPGGETASRRRRAAAAARHRRPHGRGRPGGLLAVVLDEALEELVDVARLGQVPRGELVAQAGCGQALVALAGLVMGLPGLLVLGLSGLTRSCSALAACTCTTWPTDAGISRATSAADSAWSRTTPVSVLLPRPT
jgi:hypothetical protein